MNSPSQSQEEQGMSADTISSRPDSFKIDSRQHVQQSIENEERDAHSQLVLKESRNGGESSVTGFVFRAAVVHQIECPDECKLR